nr:hypothetical protein [Tanacetum cinerariifolium]
MGPLATRHHPLNHHHHPSLPRQTLGLPLARPPLLLVVRPTLSTHYYYLGHAHQSTKEQTHQEQQELDHLWERSGHYLVEV